MKKRFTLVCATTFILIALSSCSQNEVVNIYSSRHYDSDLALYDAFTEQTGIEVRTIEGGGDELIERMKNEGENSPADILITVDAGRLWRAEQADVFQAHGSDALNAAVPDVYREEDELWVGLSKRVRGIIYHKDRVDVSQLKGYKELASDEWKGRICIRSSNNIYNQSLMASIIEKEGNEAAQAWAEALVANFAQTPQGGDTDQIRFVAAGICDVAIVNHYYLERLRLSEQETDRETAAQVDIWFPPMEFGGTHVNISGAGLAKYAPNRANGLRFLEFLITPEAQELYAIANREYSILEDGVESDTKNITENGRGLENGVMGDGLHVSTYGKNNPDAIRMMDRAGWK